MHLNYNFAFKESNLREWQRPSPPNLLVSDVSFNKKLKYIFKVFNSNPGLFYPPSLIFILSLGLQITTIYTNNLLKIDQSSHNQFIIANNKLKSFDSSKKRYQKNMQDLESNFSNSTNSFLFAYYLQNSVPKGVQLNSYSYSDNGFDINASAYSLDSLNEFLTLLIESPVIKKSSVNIDKLTRQELSQNQESIISTNFQLSIYGQVEKLNIKQRDFLYNESRADGLLKKLRRFNELKNILRK